MTLTFNAEKYKELLAQYQPKLIRTEEENEKALMLVEELMNRAKRSPEENELYQLLILLIENFERNFYFTNSTTSHSLLEFLMEQQDMSEEELEEKLSSSELASKLLDGSQKISEEEAIMLSKIFHVEPTLFLESTS